MNEMMQTLINGLNASCYFRTLINKDSYNHCVAPELILWICNFELFIRCKLQNFKYLEDMSLHSALSGVLENFNISSVICWIY